MRLTLRTLLAYLDDTLDANEIKEIGQKVSESDDAQELISRIKQVTRRRRLTAPPATGPNSLDPNDVAEYLDNELDTDQVKEVEKLCLESDLHLAEIAACHQILTLVLGEPALVPPKSKERMYGLVQGREAIPFRKAAAPRKDAEALEDEETLGLGGGWLRWVLPAAAVLLVTALAVAIYQVLPPRKDGRVATNGGKAGTTEKDRNGTEDKDGDKKKVEHPPLHETEKGKGKEKGKEKEPDEKGKTPEGKGTENGGKKDGKEPGDGSTGKEEKDPAVVKRSAPPDTARVIGGNYVGGFSDDIPTVLVSRQPGADRSQKITRGGVIHTADTLTALPGFAAVVRSPSGAGLMLRGHLRDHSIHPMQELLMESAVVLHRNKEFDLDLTLLRGRIFLSNQKKGPVTIRLRFDAEVWDLTLADRGAEVGIDLFRVYTQEINYRADEEPRASLFLCMFKGEGEVKVDAFHSYSLEGDGTKAMMMMWDSFRKTTPPRRLDQVPSIWDKRPPADDAVPEARRAHLRQVRAALKGLEGQLNEARMVDLPIKENLSRDDVSGPMRMLCIYCLGALDQADKLVEVLGDEDPAHAPDRAAALYTLRRWISRGVAQGKELYDAKAKTGVLINRKFRPREAEAIFDMLHDFRVEDWGKPETFEALARGLQNPKVAIAELAYFHLVQLSIGAKLPAGFNAALPREDREKYAEKIMEMINKKQLPPPPPPEKPGTPTGPIPKG